MSMSYIDWLNRYCRSQLDNIWSKPSWYFKGYSSYWRVTRSDVEAIELARVLKSLTRVVGHIGMNVGRVIWRDQVSPDVDRESIILPSNFVLDDYPVPRGKMDVLIGVVVHEALRQTEWSGSVWREMINKRQEFNEISNFMKKDILWKLFWAGENIYLEKRVAGNILGDYTIRTRKALVPVVARDLSRNPTAGSLFEMWEYMALGEVSFPGMNPLYEEPLSKLQKRTQDIDAVAGDGRRRGSIIERCRSRGAVYLAMWDDIEPFIRGWERDPVTYFEEGTTVRKVKKKKRRKKDQEPPVEGLLSQETLEGIDEELARGSKDLTPTIKKMCNNDPRVLRTTITDFTIPASVDTDRQLVMRLKSVFQQYAERVKKINRGLESGKVDRRRLYRAPIDGRCFKIEQMLSEIAWNFTVVIDASMSMAGGKWRVVENTMNALFKALQGYQNNLRIFGYLESSGICIVSELLRKNVLYSISPYGKTPSGQGILAAALQMPRQTKGRKFLLHITDGESNAGIDVKYALDYCKEESIDILTLGCGYTDKDVLIEQYGKRLQFIDTIDELPRAIEWLFKRILYY